MKRFTKPMWMAIAGLMLVLSACGGQPSTPDAASVDAIYTQAAGTVAAKLTMTASVYTDTPEPSPTNTVPAFTETPLITSTPLITNTPVIIATQGKPTQVSCDNMVLVSDVTITDNSKVAPGSKFVKTWHIKNNGQCTWTTTYHLLYSYSSDSWKNIKQSPPANVNITKSVAPGEETDISVNLIAPTASGVYSAYFRMANDRGYSFGMLIWVTFQVNGTPTP